MRAARLVCRQWALHLLSECREVSLSKDTPWSTPARWAEKVPRAEVVRICKGDLLTPPEGRPRTICNLSLLSQLPCLTRLDLCDWVDLRPGVEASQGLGALAKLPRLTHLDLPPGGRVTDTLLAGLVGSLGGLLHFSAQHCQYLTARGMKALSSLSSLTHLDIRGCTGITPRELGAVVVLPASLTSLNLGQCYQLTDTALSCLNTLTALRLLALPYLGRVTDAGLSSSVAPRMASVASLDLRFCGHITDDGVTAVLMRCRPSLTFLDLTSCEEVTDTSLRALANAPSLRHLALWGCFQVTDAGLRACLPHLHSLTHLDLGGCRQLTDSGLEELAALLGLQYLQLWGTRVTDDGLQPLAALTALTHLDLQGCAITDAGLPALRPLTSLTELNLVYSSVTHAAAQQLRQDLRRLQSDPILSGLPAACSTIFRDLWPAP